MSLPPDLPPFDPRALASRYLFFTGKGGVGKTTLACATAVALAQAGERVLLVSTDPASNLSETLGVAAGASPTPIPDCPNLAALDVDPEQAAEAYRERVLAPLLGQLSPAELAVRREELSGACTVEIAAFDRFAGLLGPEEGAGWDRLVFDTAPTGHTLRLLELPRAWTDFLGSNERGASCLGPHAALTQRRERFEAARAALEDPALTTLVLVTRPEGSALREAARAAEELATLGLRNQLLVVNGLVGPPAEPDEQRQAWAAREQAALRELPAALSELPRSGVALREFEALGTAALGALLAPGAPAPPSGAASPAGPESSELSDLGELVSRLEREGPRLVLVMGKGGVGKTTVAAALAVELAARGTPVLLSTTDPAAHLSETVAQVPAGLELSRIDPAAETAAYVEFVLRTKGRDLDEDGRALLREDLASPCTEEVAVFHAFTRIVNRARGRVVILDTAPTGHTLLLLDATGSYHRDVLEKRAGPSAGRLITPLQRLRDPAYSQVVLVTLPETTPVSEAAALQEDLRRAGIEPTAWVVNASLALTAPRDPLLRQRAALEARALERARALAPALYAIPWVALPPRGPAALRALCAAP